MRSKGIYTKFIGALIKRGGKERAQNILHRAFDEVSKESGLSRHGILLALSSDLNTFVELRKVGSSGGQHLVPSSLNYSRRSYLLSKFFFDGISQDSRKICLSKKISLEILDIVNKRTSKSVSLRNKVVDVALGNRSNFHYRW